MTATPVPQDFKFAWSYGAINAYEICPLKYYEEKVRKSVPYEKNEKTIWGEDVHEALEHGAKSGVPLPSNMVQYQPTLDKVEQLAVMSEHIEYERQFAINRENRPTGWWSADVAARCASDVFAVVVPEYAIVIDYKTGKPPFRGDIGKQPVINAKLAFDHYHQVQRIDTAFVFMQHKQTYNDTFLREDIEHDFQPTAEVIFQIGKALEHQNFPATKNFLCGKYCGVLTCPHNGRT